MTNTIPNVPRELLDSLLTVIESNGYAADEVEVVDELRALLSAPSPAGVDGLEVYITDCATCVDVVPAKTVTDAKVVLAKDAQAIIDGLRGEVAELQSMITNLSRAGIRMRTERDQQAQRIGELEGLLLRVQVSLSLDDTEWGYSGAEKYKLLADIRAALSAGKDSDQ